MEYRGGARGASAEPASTDEDLPNDAKGMDKDKEGYEGNEVEGKEDTSELEDNGYGGNEVEGKEGTSELEDKGKNDDTGEQEENNREMVLNQDQELFKAIKKAHDLAKAVKSDDAEVPKHLWDVAVCRGPPSLEQAKALSTLRVFMLRIYRK